MYVVMTKGTEKCAVIREQKRLSAYIKASVGTIRAHITDSSWEWENFTIYNPSYLDLGTRKKGNPRNFTKQYEEMY